MNDGLNGCNPCDMSVEQVEGCKAPTRRPEKYIVATSKEPNQGNIRK